MGLKGMYAVPPPLPAHYQMPPLPAHHVYQHGATPVGGMPPAQLGYGAAPMKPAYPMSGEISDISTRPSASGMPDQRHQHATGITPTHTGTWSDSSQTANTGASAQSIPQVGGEAPGVPQMHVQVDAPGVPPPVLA